MASARGLGAVCLLLLAAVSSRSLPRARAAADEPTRDKVEVMKHCVAYMRKSIHYRYPQYNGECCKVIRASRNVRAICDRFTAEELDAIRLDLWVALAKFCGNEMPAGADCAGYIVPAPSLY